MTKTEIVKQMFLSGNHKAALRIAKDFKIGITRQEANDMQLAYECMVHGSFYRQLGKDADAAIKKVLRYCRVRCYGWRYEDIYQSLPNPELQSGNYTVVGITRARPDFR